MEPKYGIIGCGHISQFYFAVLGESKNSVAHVADLNIDMAKKYAELYNARCSTEYIDVINDPDVSAVVVLVHGKFHKEVCLAAIKAGKDVICEKTLSNNAQEAYEIAKAAQDAGVIFFTSYMKRFFPASQKAKELLPKLGLIYSAYSRSYQFWGNLYENTEEIPTHIWLDGYGGGVLKCAGSHLLDLTMFLLGRPKSLYANVDYVENTKLDRKAMAILEYPGSLSVCFETAGHSLSRIGYGRNNWDERIEINGINGRLDICFPVWDKPLESAALLVHYDETSQTSTEYRFEAVDSFHDEIEYFHDCLAKRQQGHPSVIDGFNVDTLISAIDESSKKQQPVTLEWKGL